MRILIVDDELVSRSKLEKIMANFGTCDSAVNGDQAVTAVRRSLEEQSPYDVVLMDLIMPVMDGHEALKRIRALEKEHDVRPGMETRVIVISSLEDQKNVCKAFFHGQATSYLTKPVNKEKLLEALSAAGIQA